MTVCTAVHCAKKYAKEENTTIAIYHGTLLPRDYRQLFTEQYTYITKYKRLLYILNNCFYELLLHERSIRVSVNNSGYGHTI